MRGTHVLRGPKRARGQTEVDVVVRTDYGYGAGGRESIGRGRDGSRAGACGGDATGVIDGGYSRVARSPCEALRVFAIGEEGGRELARLASPQAECGGRERDA